MPPRHSKKSVAKRPTPKKGEPLPEPEKAPVEEKPQIPVAEEKSAADEAPVASDKPTTPKQEDRTEEEEEDDEADGNDENEDVAEEEEDVEAEEGNPEDNVEKPDDQNMEDEDGESENDAADKGDDPSSYVPSEKSKKRKEVEVFVGGLNNKVKEDDLIKTFGAFGEVQFARVARSPGSKKSKGFAFIQFANVEQAKKVLAELKDGVEIQGKRATVSASTANDTLYVGNICKTWTADQVQTTLKGLGVEHDFEMLLSDDPNNEGSNKGYAFLEFSNHFDAMAAFQLLKSPDAVFGRDKKARVSFAYSAKHVSEDSLAQVKTVYVEGLPSSWDEENIKELCKQYGEIERIELSRNFTRKRRKDYGFIAFVSRESALACVEGINNLQVGEGESKISANLAKSERKRRAPKSEGEKEDDQSEKENGLPKSGNTKSSKNSKSGGKASGSKDGAQGNKKTPDISGGKKRKGKKLDSNVGGPYKRQRKDRGFGNARGSKYSGASTGYQSSDLEPHAGLLPSGRRENLSPQFGRGKRNAYPGRRGPSAQYPYPGHAPDPGYQAYPYPGASRYPPRRAYY